MEYFQRTGERVEGRYVFDLDLSDEDCSYDISFFTRIDKPLLRNVADTSFRLAVNWTSDQGDILDEAVWFPIDSTQVLYRKGVSMVNPGIWTLCVETIGEPVGMRGLGIICKRNENGTR